MSGSTAPRISGSGRTATPRCTRRRSSSAARDGPGYNTQYAQAGFEADLPAIEGTCDPVTGDGLHAHSADRPRRARPRSTRSTPTTMKGGGGCMWQFGNDIPGEISNYGQNGQYGTLLRWTTPTWVAAPRTSSRTSATSSPTRVRRRNASALRAAGAVTAPPRGPPPGGPLGFCAGARNSLRRPASARRGPGAAARYPHSRRSGSPRRACPRPGSARRAGPPGRARPRARGRCAW